MQMHNMAAHLHSMNYLCTHKPSNLFLAMSDSRVLNGAVHNA